MAEIDWTKLQPLVLRPLNRLCLSEAEIAEDHAIARRVMTRWLEEDDDVRPWRRH